MIKYFKRWHKGPREKTSWKKTNVQKKKLIIAEVFHCGIKIKIINYLSWFIILWWVRVTKMCIIILCGIMKGCLVSVVLCGIRTLRCDVLCISAVWVMVPIGCAWTTPIWAMGPVMAHSPTSVAAVHWASSWLRRALCWEMAAPLAPVATRGYW